MGWVYFAAYTTCAYIILTHVQPSEQVLIAGCFLVSNLVTFVCGLIDA